MDRCPIHPVKDRSLSVGRADIDTVETLTGDRTAAARGRNTSHDEKQCLPERREFCGNGLQEDGSRNVNGEHLRYEITEEDCYDELGFCFPKWKKWYIIGVIFWIQVSMNFNTSLYSNAIGGISDEFGVSHQAARCGAMIFLVTYAFGCELWAPWSEELGRWPILQLSMLLVNIWQLPVALAPNFATIMVGRALGGLSTAGGSVTLGMVADMWEPSNQQYAVAFVVFSSVLGSVLGPIVGGFCEAYLEWRYVMPWHSVWPSFSTDHCQDGRSGYSLSLAALLRSFISSPSQRLAPLFS